MYHLRNGAANLQHDVSLTQLLCRAQKQLNPDFDYFPKTYHFLAYGGIPIYIQEYCGPDLFIYFRGVNKRDKGHLCAKFEQQIENISAVLRFANVYNNDVKPNNILVKNETLKLVDFGNGMTQKFVDLHKT